MLLVQVYLHGEFLRMATNWELLKTASGSSAASIDLASLPNRRYLFVQGFVEGGNGLKYQFNGVTTGDEYSMRYAQNGGSDGTQIERNDIWCYYDSNDEYMFNTTYITNEENKEKMAIMETTSNTSTTTSGNPVIRTRAIGKWSNNAVIDEITLGSFATADELVCNVFGSNGKE